MRRYEVEDTVDRAIERVFKYKHCPTCKGYVTMIDIRFTPDAERDEDFLSACCRHTFKCLKCNDLFVEELKKV